MVSVRQMYPVLIALVCLCNDDPVGIRTQLNWQKKIFMFYDDNVLNMTTTLPGGTGRTF